MIQAQAWAMTQRNKKGDPHPFRLQFFLKDGRSTRRINREMKEAGWLSVGTGYNPKKKLETLIFQKNFDSREDFVDWATDQQKIEIVELNSKGMQKAIYKVKG